MSHRSSGPWHRRRAARLAVLGIAAATIAPLAVQGTASASTTKWHRDAVSTARIAAEKAALRAAAGAARPASVTHHRAVSGKSEFDSSQFPAHGSVVAMVQLSPRPAVRAYSAARPQGRAAANTAAQSQREHIAAVSRSVRAHFSSPATSAYTLYTVHNVYAGIAVRTNVHHLAHIAALAGVRAVHPLATFHRTNASTVPMIGAPQTWEGGDNIGQGVRVGIVDTGIDYTHANFGGSGSRHAYDADHSVADSSSLSVPSGDFPSDKVVGGIDFAGDAYDADSDDPAAATPHTDPNPLDCNGHGSHVAGTAAGLGVNTDGTTFDGSYGDLNDLSAADYRDSFRIGPGVAPGADLYAIKVFGCDGSTNLVPEALDWAADPDGNGNFSDHLDVINMSLGSDFVTADNSEAEAANNLSLLGTTVVNSAGNAGDEEAVAGTPGNASRSITVAAVDDPMAIYDGLQVNEPDDTIIPGQRGVLYDWANNGPVTGDVVAVNPDWQPGDDFTDGNADGCEPFTAEQAARVAGKIAWEEWTDDDATRACGSLGRAQNAADAGAIGVILTDDEDTFPAGINGSPDVPTFQIFGSDADNYRDEAEAGDGSLNVTLTYDLRNSITQVDDDQADTLVPFSSRGWGADGLKPDVAAPGVSVFSTAVGTGNEGTSDSGTSMAAPHVTGVAALVKAAHPGYFPEQIKAAIMNTASHDVYSTPADDRDPATDREAPDRVGAGRVDAARAPNADVLAYSFGTNGGVGVTFGMPEVSQTKTFTRFFQVENNTGSDKTYALSYDPANDGTQPAGVSYDFPQPSVTVPAHSTRTFPVTMTVDPEQLDRPIDSTRTPDPLDLGATSTSYVPEAAGWIKLSQGPDEMMRLPLYGAPKAMSDMHATSHQVAFTDQGSDDVSPGDDFGQIDLAGTGFDTDAYQSLVSGYELGATSPEKPDCGPGDDDPTVCNFGSMDRAADIRDVGATSDYGTLVDLGFPQDAIDSSLTTFAVAAYGPWQTPAGQTEFDVNIDTDGDGNPDLILFNTRVDATDVMVTEAYDVAADDIVDIEFTNASTPDADTNAFSSDVMELPVLTSFITDHTDSGQISYWVDAYSVQSGLTDESDVASFNVTKPGVVVDDATDAGANAYNFSFNVFPMFWSDNDGNSLTVRRDKAQLQADNAGRLMLVHQNNAVGDTVELLRVGDATQSTLHLSKTRAQYSAPVTATVKVSAAADPQPTGKVQLLVDGKVVRSKLLSNGGAAFNLPRLKVGHHQVKAHYVGDGGDQPSTSAPAALRVVKQRTGTALHARKVNVHRGKRDVFRAVVTGAAGTQAAPQGSVRFKVDGEVWKTVALRHGVAKASETGFAKGRHRIVAIYLGNSNQRRSSDALSITVG